MFSEKCEISKCRHFLISYPIFIIFAPICMEIFTLSFKIMITLDWTSPLIKRILACLPDAQNLDWMEERIVFVLLFELSIYKTNDYKNYSENNFTYHNLINW